MEYINLKIEQFYSKGSEVTFTIDRGATWQEGKLSIYKKRGGNLAKVTSKETSATILHLNRVRIKISKKTKLKQSFKKLQGNLLKLSNLLVDLDVKVSNLKKDYGI